MRAEKFINRYTNKIQKINVLGVSAEFSFLLDTENGAMALREYLLTRKHPNQTEFLRY